MRSAELEQASCAQRLMLYLQRPRSRTQVVSDRHGRAEGGSKGEGRNSYSSPPSWATQRTTAPAMMPAFQMTFWTPQAMPSSCGGRAASRYLTTSVVCVGGRASGKTEQGEGKRHR
jgi:hypothetical protein